MTDPHNTFVEKAAIEFESFDSFFAGLRPQDEKDSARLYELYLYDYIHKVCLAAVEHGREEGRREMREEIKQVIPNIDTIINAIKGPHAV